MAVPRRPTQQQQQQQQQQYPLMRDFYKHPQSELLNFCDLNPKIRLNGCATSQK